MLKKKLYIFDKFPRSRVEYGKYKVFMTSLKICSNPFPLRKSGIPENMSLIHLLKDLCKLTFAKNVKQASNIFSQK